MAIGVLITIFFLLFHAPSQSNLVSQPQVDNVQASLLPEDYFSIHIPKISARANITPNVSVVNKQDYTAALKTGIAHARGTNFPGGGEKIFLFAHSADSPLNIAKYNATFYALAKLDKGDMIEIKFMGDNYSYEVIDKRIVSASDTSAYTQKSTEEVLVLQTCHPPGTTWKRLLVIARPKTS